jgi:hypothetical protein
MGGIGVLLGVVLAAAATPQESGGDAPDRLGGVNPARLIPRLELRQRFTDLANQGGRLHSTTLRMDVVLFRRGLLRYEMPLLVQRTADGTHTGIGDIRLSALALLTSGPRHAAVVLGGVSLDSATRPPLGAGRPQVTFGGAAGFKPLPWLLNYAIVGQSLSFGGETTRPPVKVLRLELGAVVFGGQGDWYTLELEAPLDLENDVPRLLGSLETGRLLLGRLALFARGGTQLLGQRQTDYFLDAGVRYLFKLE